MILKIEVKVFVASCEEGAIIETRSEFRYDIDFEW